MDKNGKEIILHLPQDNNFTGKVFEILNKINAIGFFSAIVFALGFFIKIGLYYYHATYLSVLGLPELFPIENYYDNPYKVWLLWLLVVIIIGYIFLIYLAMYLFLKNLDSFRKTCIFYFIVQLIFVTFALIAAKDNVQRTILIGFLLAGSILVGLSGYFSKKNTKKNKLNKRTGQIEFIESLVLGVASFIFINSLVFLNLYIISIKVGGTIGEDSGNSTKKTILEGEYKNKLYQSVKLYEEVDLIYFEKCIEKDCFGFTVNEDGKIILKEFDRSEIDHSYIRKK